MRHVIGNILDISEEELNTSFGPVGLDKDSDAYLDEYMEKYVGTDLYSSDSFRKQCVEAGYRIKGLYPIYYQGWEMDEWGAIAIKEGKRYNLGTNHGSLTAEEIPSILDAVRKILDLISQENKRTFLLKAIKWL